MFGKKNEYLLTPKLNMLHMFTPNILNFTLLDQFSPIMQLHIHYYHIFFKKIHRKSTVYSSKVSVVISSFSHSPDPCLMCVTGCGMFGAGEPPHQQLMCNYSLMRHNG